MPVMRVEACINDQRKKKRGGSTKTKTQSVRLGVVSDKEWNCEIHEAKPHSLSSPVMTTAMDIFICSWSLTCCT